MPGAWRPGPGPSPAPSPERAWRHKPFPVKQRVCLFRIKGGWAPVQVGLGGIQAQPLYNLRDLGRPRLSDPCPLIWLIGAKIPPGRAVVGAEQITCHKVPAEGLARSWCGPGSSLCALVCVGVLSPPARSQGQRGAHLHTACGTTAALAGQPPDLGLRPSARGAGRVPRNAIHLPSPRADLLPPIGHLQPGEAAPWARLSTAGGAARPARPGMCREPHPEFSRAAVSPLVRNVLYPRSSGSICPPAPLPSLAILALRSGRTRPQPWRDQHHPQLPRGRIPGSSAGELPRDESRFAVCRRRCRGSWNCTPIQRKETKPLRLHGNRISGPRTRSCWASLHLKPLACVILRPLPEWPGRETAAQRARQGPQRPQPLHSPSTAAPR